mmetsp:Transcript_58920/g.124977  ORF Transcript_58920/g.124977 Transcript_58920/m.124977 type:complete len:315 (-) Transcript_58920:141-1085(-)|eukprot:CAMPEP_0206463326 /NCGR_PEP_ID=MMETSP0324_2-20121206/26531_1 /ASSEMBLY_ACC=CAM_ASM_000836 /TAXON_ID=2866 /ORGANISM="Crypthecodinium cohnii, Strain Seligo" /LENGTH=314 /DNA_ID=CAMNT_0053935699 /DNA_START=102 /DNA_END=1046 /DNA_ORIENTATION=-
MAQDTPVVKEVHVDIAREIGQQVERIILQAKHNNETKVGKEILKVTAKMEQLSAKIALVSERVAKLEDTGSRPMRKDTMEDAVAKMDSVWNDEVMLLKHELWQTIQAHNHNADLLRHHKESIDEVEEKLKKSVIEDQARGGQAAELLQVQKELTKLEKTYQSSQLPKDEQLQDIVNRVTIVQQALQKLTWLQLSLSASSYASVDPQALALGGLGSLYEQQNLHNLSGYGASAGTSMGGYGHLHQQELLYAKMKSIVEAQSKAAAKKSLQAMPMADRNAHLQAAAAAAAAAASLRAEAPEFVPAAPGLADHHHAS